MTDTMQLMLTDGPVDITVELVTAEMTKAFLSLDFGQCEVWLAVANVAFDQKTMLEITIDAAQRVRSLAPEEFRTPQERAQFEEDLDLLRSLLPVAATS